MRKFTIAFRSVPLCVLAAAVLMTFSPGPSLYANGYPSQPIELVIGSSPGGGFDLQGRVFAKEWPKHLPNKVNMIVNNVDGGGGIESANQVWGSAPDGYKIVQLKLGAYILTEILHPAQVKFNMAQWQYIGTYTHTINAMVTRPNLWEKIKTFQDLVNLSKKKPLLVATGGANSATHNFLQIFSEVTGVPMRFVHYAGAAENRTALIRGDIDFVIGPPAYIQKQDPKDMRTLFVINDATRRYTYAPGSLEFGVPKDQYQKLIQNPILMGFRCWAVPSKTPANVVKILKDSYWKSVESKELNEAFDKMGDFLAPKKDADFEKELPAMISDIKKISTMFKK